MGFQSIFHERSLKLSASFLHVNKSDIPPRGFIPDFARFGSAFLVSPDEIRPSAVDVAVFRFGFEYSEFDFGTCDRNTLRGKYGGSNGVLWRPLK